MQEQPVLLEEDGFEDEILVEEETTVVNAMWGDIGGNIENQTDLQNALDAKQDGLTEAQLNAVNSGITAEKVTTYDGYADQIASKANQSALNAEATTREQADTALGRRIDNEATARQQADNGLQSQIDAITSQSDVVDVVANYAALQAYDTSSLSDNDVIKVLDDETHEDALTYYRWSTTTQTWSYIGQEAPYYSKGQMDVMLQGKQDKLTAGANIQIQNGTISATDTTYTAGNGLNLNGTEFSADTDILATKEDLEDYYTKSETDNLLAPKLEAEVVAELPTTGEEGKLYLTPKAHTTQTATGNPITATVAEEAGKLESFKLDGDTFQQTYEGKNLFDFVSRGTTQGLTATYDTETGTITVTGTATTNYSNISIPVDLALETGQTFTSSIDTELPVRVVTRVIYSDNTEASFNIEPGETSVTWSPSRQMTQIRLYISLTVPGNSYDLSFKFQIVSGSTPDYDFEPYVGGTPSPSPDYPQPIQTVTGLQTVEVQGKNLFDKTSQMANGYSYASDGTLVVVPTASVQEVYIQVEPNTTYTLHTDATSSQTADFRIYICEYTADKAFIQRDIPSPATANTNTITTTSNTHFVRLCFSTISIDTLQFEKSALPTTYVPYFKQTYTIDLGDIKLCGLGDDGSGGFLYEDHIYRDGDDWKLHKATGEFVFTADTTPQNGRSKNGNMGFVLNAENNPIPNMHIPLVGACSCFAVESTTTTWTGINRTGVNTSGALWFQTGDSDNPDIRYIAQFFEWLAGSNATYNYALATPTDTVITDTTLIAQLEAIRTASLQNGANTITNSATGSNLAGDMEIGYYGFNPRNRYDKWLWLDINSEYEQIGG